jgi:hypothetical protein
MNFRLEALANAANAANAAYESAAPSNGWDDDRPGQRSFGAASNSVLSALIHQSLGTTTGAAVGMAAAAAAGTPAPTTANATNTFDSAMGQALLALSQRAGSSDVQPAICDMPDPAIGWGMGHGNSSSEAATPGVMPPSLWSRPSWTDGNTSAPDAQGLTGGAGGTTWRKARGYITIKNGANVSLENIAAQMAHHSTASGGVHAVAAQVTTAPTGATATPVAPPDNSSTNRAARDDPAAARPVEPTTAGLLQRPHRAATEQVGCKWWGTLEGRAEVSTAPQSCTAARQRTRALHDRALRGGAGHTAVPTGHGHAPGQR